MFVFLCIGRSQNYSKSDLKAPPSVNCPFEVILKVCFLNSVKDLRPLLGTTSTLKFQSPLLKPLVLGENKLSFLACILVPPTLCLLLGDKYDLFCHFKW